MKSRTCVLSLFFAATFALPGLAQDGAPAAEAVVDDAAPPVAEAAPPGAESAALGAEDVPPLESTTSAPPAATEDSAPSAGAPDALFGTTTPDTDTQPGKDPAEPTTGTTEGTAPLDPGLAAPVDALEVAYRNCLDSEAPEHDVVKCLQQLAAEAPTSDVGRRAQTVLDMVTVMKRSGTQFAGENPPAAPSGPFEFGSVVARIPLTVTGVAYGLSLGTGTAVITTTALPGLEPGLLVLAGGVLAVGAAVGAGSLGYWLSGPERFGSEGAWLGSGSMAAGAGMGFALAIAAVDLGQTLPLGYLQRNQLATTSLIGLPLLGGALGTAGGIAAAHYMDLDDDQVAVVNGSMLYGAILGASIGLGVGGTINATIPNFQGSIAAAAGTYMLLAGGTTAASLWAVNYVNFNAIEVLVAGLGMSAASGVMVGTSGVAVSMLNLGSASAAVVGGTTAVAASVGFFGTAAILYALRDDARPFLREMQQAGIMPIMTPATVGVDRTGEFALYTPQFGLSF